jgi:hypothetical protein
MIFYILLSIFLDLLEFCKNLIKSVDLLEFCKNLIKSVDLLGFMKIKNYVDGIRKLQTCKIFCRHRYNKLNISL